MWLILVWVQIDHPKLAPHPSKHGLLVLWYTYTCPKIPEVVMWDSIGVCGRKHTKAGATISKRTIPKSLYKPASLAWTSPYIFSLGLCTFGALRNSILWSC